MATRSRGFPPAARPDVVRAAQKDETYAAVRRPDARRDGEATDARDATTRRRDEAYGTTLPTDDATRRDATRRARSDGGAAARRVRARAGTSTVGAARIARCGRAGGRRTRR